MNALRLSIFGFVLASALLAAWLFGHWYEYGMLDFACADGHQTACDGTEARRIALRVGIAVAAWAAWALLLFRVWKKS